MRMGHGGRAGRAGRAPQTMNRCQKLSGWLGTTTTTTNARIKPSSSPKHDMIGQRRRATHGLHRVVGQNGVSETTWQESYTTPTDLLSLNAKTRKI